MMEIALKQSSMKAEHWVGKISLRALIESKGHVLICRGRGDVNWQLPGGRLHFGEEPQDALLREVREELGITVEKCFPFYMQTFIHFRTNVPQLVIVYQCSTTHQSINIDREAIEETKWASFHDFDALPMYEDCRNAIGEFFQRQLASTLAQ